MPGWGRAVATGVVGWVSAPERVMCARAADGWRPVVLAEAALTDNGRPMLANATSLAWSDA